MGLTVGAAVVVVVVVVVLVVLVGTAVTVVLVVLLGTASSIDRCTVPVMMTGANTSTDRWRYQHARRSAGVARTRGDPPRAGRGSAGKLGGYRPAGAPIADDGGP